MSLDSRSVSDTDILESSKMIDEGNNCVSFKLQLPSGRMLTSDSIPRGTKGAALSWCQAVRDQIAADEQAAERESAERKAAQRREVNESAPSVEETDTSPMNVPGSPEAGSTITPTSPEDWVRKNYEAARASELATRLKHQRASAQLEQWEVLYKALELTEETGEENDGSSQSESEASETGSSRDTSGDSSDLRTERD